MRVTSVDFELCQVLQRCRRRHVARSSFLPIGNRDFLVSLLRRLAAPRRRKDIQTYNTIIIITLISSFSSVRFQITCQLLTRRLAARAGSNLCAYPIILLSCIYNNIRYISKILFVYKSERKRS